MEILVTFRRPYSKPKPHRKPKHWGNKICYAEMRVFCIQKLLLFKSLGISSLFASWFALDFIWRKNEILPYTIFCVDN